ncbi:extracellular solute-binding protein [Paenibacillus turpanensis]|uniref:extracellular solute-binding protein n=1 Tax=Paenibacillus turpanensis TaxID=2689078 RepID=UPI0014075000|nr:extracellular solute-binding protein [Paenibacillus turpanensis]
MKRFESTKSISSSRLYLLTACFAIILLLSACSLHKQQPQIHVQEILPAVHITLPLMQPKPPTPELLQALEQATGTRVHLEWVPSNLYREHIVSLLETNKFKEVTYIPRSDFLYVKNLIQSGQFWEIGPFLKSYPNLSKLNTNLLQESSYQAKIYGLPIEQPPAPHGIMIRKDWLDNLQLEVPSTLDELYTVLRAFTYDDPDGDGEHNTTGLADRSDLTYGAFKTLSSYFGAPNRWAVENGRFIPEFETKPYWDAMDYMRRLYAEGLVNNDLAVASEQVQRYMMIEGRAGVYIGSLADAPSLHQEMQRLQPKAELALLNRIFGPGGYQTWADASYSGFFIFSKKELPAVEDLQRALSFWDRSLENETSRLLHYGLEDTSLENLPSGNPAASPLRSLALRRYSDPDSWKEQQPIMLKALQMAEDNKNLLVKDPAASLSSPTFDMKGEELQEIIINATYHYILGKLDRKRFLQEIEAWKSKGGAIIISELETEYRKQNAS